MNSTMNRRSLILAAGAAVPLAAAAPAMAELAPAASGLVDLDPIRTELVMNLVVTCSNPEVFGPSPDAKDGKRTEIWPIIGGRFEGPNIRGRVIPGGADYPVTRPDGVDVIDAFYRLQEDDGTSILIHNVGFVYPPAGGARETFRLVPTFTTSVGRHDWLNRSIFLATLVYGDAIPPELRVAKGPDENDRVIQVHRVV